MTQKTSQPVTSRPLSPHLQIYKWGITMALSILHRITGVALAIGSLLLVGWLWAAAYSPQCFASLNSFFADGIGKFLLFCWSVAFYLHFCNGIRHLFWDIGKGYEIGVAKRSGWAVVIMTAFFTFFTWMTILKGGK